MASLLQMTMQKLEMLMRTIQFILIISLLFGQLLAQTPSQFAGTASNLFLRSGLSTRVSGMGETFTAIADDENALYYNPAGLANITQGAVGLNHTQWFEDIRMDNLVFGYNFDRKLGIGFSVSHMWMPALQGKDNFGNATGDISVSSSILNLGLGYKVHSSFYVGLGIKYFQDNLAEFTASGLALDAGIYMYTFVPGLTFGLAVQNMGGDIQYDASREKLPLLYRAGFAYNLSRTGLRIAVDGIKSIDSDFAIGTAIEYTLLKTFSIRLGNQFRPDQKFTPGYGAGLNISEQYLIDYTFYEFEDLGATHRIGFTFRFDLPGVKIRPRTYYGTTTIKKSKAPSSLYYVTNDDRLTIHWGRIYGAAYNVYAKTSKGGTWKKLNTSLVENNFLEFKKPTGSTEAIYVCVTSVINSVESAFSKEVKIDVK